MPAVPSKRSNLRFPSGPILPASPRTSLPSRQYQFLIPSGAPLASPSEPLPPTPQTWQWTCHVCKYSYPLGVTRRCLRDGHYFCSGTTVSKKNGVRKHHASCTSEFDYTGWRQQADWRRRQSQYQSSRSAKNCWNNCDYPSECRWASTLHNPHHNSHEPTPTFESILSSSPSASAPIVETSTSSPRSDLLSTIRRVTEKRAQNLQALVTNINEISSPLLNRFLPNLAPVVERFDEENPRHPYSQFLASADYDIYDAGIVKDPQSPKEEFSYATSYSYGHDNPPGGGAVQVHASPLRSNPPGPPIQPPSPVLAMPEWMDIDINAPSRSGAGFSSFPPYGAFVGDNGDESPISPPRASFGFKGLPDFEFGFEKVEALVEGLGIGWEGTERRDSGYATLDEEKDDSEHEERQHQ